MWKKKMIIAFLACAVGLSTLGGCGKIEENTTIVLTTGFNEDEVFKMGNVSCTVPEIMVYLTTIKCQYETVYGSQIWEAIVNGVTLEENIKENSLAKIAQIKAMTLLAVANNIFLTEEEQVLVEEAASTYYHSLDEATILALGIDEETVITLYEDYALANSVYHYLIQDVNPEISDDAARVITVEQIFIKTYTVDGEGNQVAFTEYAKKEALSLAQTVLEEANAGEEFTQLISKYSDSQEVTYSFHQGEMEESFEKVAFDLATDEVSEIIETENGYHILKCISTFDQTETDANKIAMVEAAREEAFNEEYEAFIATITKDLNEELWEEISFIEEENVSTTEFFEIFSTYFDN